ncbi:MAG TPA: hypothetical protein VHV08_10070 [Pirellulales bacterium]|nr:hypothetical protein [Pirellulales bacterium]
MSQQPNPPRMRLADSWLLRAGILLLLLGTGPLLAIILAAQLGLTNDPNPNPVGPGLLAGVTFLPSLVLIVIGIVRVIVANGRSK